MRNATTIMLPLERAQQLRNIATNLDMSIASAIGVMIRHQIAEGIIDDALPGFRVNPRGKQVEFALDDGDSVPLLMPAEAANSLAHSLDQVADGKSKGVLDLDAGVEIFRVGTGIRLKAAGLEKTVTSDIAHDIAGLLRKTGAKSL